MYKIAKPVMVKYGISLRTGLDLEWNCKVMLINRRWKMFGGKYV